MAFAVDEISVWELSLSCGALLSAPRTAAMTAMDRSAGWPRRPIEQEHWTARALQLVALCALFSGGRDAPDAGNDQGPDCPRSTVPFSSAECVRGRRLGDHRSIPQWRV